MISDTLEVERDELLRRTGWEIKPQGACKGDVCVPLQGRLLDGDTVDMGTLAPLLGMPVVHDEEHALWAFGPESGGRALSTAVLPPIELPDIRTGESFDLSSSRGRKVVLVAWASW
ncbi:MAG: hypothetical protein QOE35_1891 [Actinomycetota bacterium]